MWPVATCDLASLLEDASVLNKHFLHSDQDETNLPLELAQWKTELEARLQALEVPTGYMRPMAGRALNLVFVARVTNQKVQNNLPIRKVGFMRYNNIPQT